MIFAKEFKRSTNGKIETFHIFNKAIVNSIDDFFLPNGYQLMTIYMEDGQQYTGKYQEEVFDLVSDLIGLEMSIVLWKNGNKYHVAYLSDVWKKLNTVLA